MRVSVCGAARKKHRSAPHEHARLRLKQTDSAAARAAPRRRVRRAAAAARKSSACGRASVPIAPQPEGRRADWAQPHAAAASRRRQQQPCRRGARCHAPRARSRPPRPPRRTAQDRALCAALTPARFCGRRALAAPWNDLTVLPRLLPSSGSLLGPKSTATTPPMTTSSGRPRPKRPMLVTTRAAPPPCRRGGGGASRAARRAPARAPASGAASPAKPARGEAAAREQPAGAQRAAEAARSAIPARATGGACSRTARRCVRWRRCDVGSHGSCRERDFRWPRFFATTRAAKRRRAAATSCGKRVHCKTPPSARRKKLSAKLHDACRLVRCLAHFLCTTVRWEGEQQQRAVGAHCWQHPVAHERLA
jgi:hypothetical protein